MTHARHLLRSGLFAALAVLALLLGFAPQAGAQDGARAGGFGSENMRAELVSDGPARAGAEWLVALHFTPQSAEWHGYWANPGDAGQGMALDWQLPQGWSAGEPLYPMPQTLVTAGLMNHIYKGDYAVLVPIRVPEGADVPAAPPLRVEAEYLACTDTLCVPQDAALSIDPARAARDSRMALWRSAIVPPLDRKASFEITGERLRIGIPVPAAMVIGKPHVFLKTNDLGGGLQPRYADVQTFIREGDLLVAEIALRQLSLPPGSDSAKVPEPATVEGLLAFTQGEGVRFTAAPGDVGLEGVKPLATKGTGAVPPLWSLALAALAGGLLLNILPCVFPILSLKALALAKAGGDEKAARRDALAYTAGVLTACLGLGLALLALRAAGENVGWAFQLQEPGVVAALFLLALALTVNFLGLFELPAMVSGGGRGSFGTGLLAAFVATPCTGPFMAAALGAALVVPAPSAMMIFASLGLGLALPYLALGFIPALRTRLPKPGPWMARFRRWMALPMGLTALALGWLVWRMGGTLFVAGMVVTALLLLAVLASLGQRQRQGRGGDRAFLLAAAALGFIAVWMLPKTVGDLDRAAAASLLPAQDFSPEALAEARASGTPVFVWFTADWCVTCKVNEQVAIEREATRDAFAKAGVKVLRGDWTRRDPVIASFLAQQGAAGVPLYLWYAPGSEAEQLPQILTQDMLVSRASQPAKAPASRR